MSSKSKHKNQSTQSSKPEESQSQDQAQDQAQEMPAATSTEVETVPEPQEGSTPTPEPEQPSTPEPELESLPEPITSTPTLTIEQLYEEVIALKQLALEHSGIIFQLQEALARKRKPVAANGKIQIRDKQTGTVYPSKNATYRTLLKAGELKELVDRGVFGPVPEKNTFGWYALVRELPDRFEEVHEAKNSEKE
jgi:hypothetical protein